MLIKVSKDLSGVTVVNNGAKYSFGLTMAYRIQPCGYIDAEKKRVAEEVSQYLVTHNLQAGEYIFTSGDRESEYRKIATLLADKTLGEITAYLADFGDEDIQKICSKLSDIVARRLVK